jgi:hypothetical protein
MRLSCFKDEQEGIFDGGGASDVLSTCKDAMPQPFQKVTNNA